MSSVSVYALHTWSVRIVSVEEVHDLRIVHACVFMPIKIECNSNVSGVLLH